MIQYQIKPFQNYILRTPAFPIQDYLELLTDYSPEQLLEIYHNPFFRESIRIASPELLQNIDNWNENPNQITLEKKIALEITVLKYFARITSRCTPFGLFSGCTVGELGNSTKIKLKENTNFSRHTQFDMHFWVSMLQKFANDKNVMGHLKFYPNSSVYSIGDFYRYVEYKYVKTKREHNIAALRKTEMLDSVLLEAKKGITIKELVQLLTHNPSENEEALEFIYQLIDFQFLVSDLEATVTGDDEWERLFSFINEIPALREKYNLLKIIQEEIKKVDTLIVAQDFHYNHLKSLIEKIEVPIEEKYLLQTDLNITTSVNNLNESISKKVQQALYFLNGIQKNNVSTNQTNFIKAFLQRYESREMPLVTVLDTEIGIGYIQNSEMNDSHDILEKFSFKSNISDEGIFQQSWTGIDFILQKKLHKTYKNNDKLILLSQNDFPQFDSHWNDTPSTFSVMIEVALNNNEEVITLESSGGISAAKLLGRFCNGNQAIYKLTKEIVAKEESFYKDKILAEIVHIPESRTGNILRRPVLRDYEIAYLSNSGVDTEYKIDLDDLMVAVNGNRIVLRSKKFNKEVIPCLSNAHNYSGKALPIYQFLCDLQGQGLKPIYNFSWGVLESHYTYFPRVVYKDVILAKAKWIIDRVDLTTFFKLKGDELLEKFSIWRKKKEIPKYVNWVYYDNTLLLDFETEIGITMFLKSVANHTKITLEEFLFDKGSVTEGQSGYYTNQFILSYYKEQMQSQN